MTEFEELKPQKNRAGNRIYSNRDIKFILRIKELLREQRYTIEGAKHILRSEQGQKMTAEEAPPPVIQDPAQIALPTEPATPVIPTASITAQEIDELIAGLAKKIEKDYANQEVVVICPLKGSFLFVADLVRKLNLQVVVDFCHRSNGGARATYRVGLVNRNSWGNAFDFVDGWPVHTV